MIRRYNHIFYRKEYPAERGYRMEARPLPDWMHLIIVEENDSLYLEVHSRIHMDKVVKLTPSYSIGWTDRQIIIDQSANIYNMFIK